MSSEPKPGLFKDLITKIKTNRKLEFGIYIALALLAIVIYASSLGGGEESPPAAQVVAVGSADLEARLEEILSGIRGAGAVRVMITYDTTEELVPAMSTQTEERADGNDTQHSQDSTPATVTRDGDEEPIVLKQIEPRVRGVIVVAQGAADISVRVDLQEAVRTVLGIELDAIEVFQMDTMNSN